MNRILIEYGGVTKLAEIFSVSRKTVRKALKGETKSDLAFKIRQAALRNGGKEYKTIN